MFHNEDDKPFKYRAQITAADKSELLWWLLWALPFRGVFAFAKIMLLTVFGQGSNDPRLGDSYTHLWITLAFWGVLGGIASALWEQIQGT